MSDTGRMRRRVLWLLLGIVLVVFWVGGGAAWVVVRVAEQVGSRLTLPRQIRFEAVAMGAWMPATTDESAGVMISLPPQRAKALLKSAVGAWRFLVPPKTLVHGLRLTGWWILRDPEEAPPLHLPLTLVVDQGYAYPTIRVRFPRSRLNALATIDGFLGDRSERKDYALGHYDLRNQYQFRELRIESDPPSRLDVSRRRLNVYVSGRVRYWFDDSLVSARSTATLRPSHLVVDLHAERQWDGVRLRYAARFETFDAGFNNVPPALDGMLAAKLQESLEDSLNRPRKIDRFARRRFPRWIPLDLMVDLELVDA